jgi:leucyl-tRNA synthetase
MRFNTAIAHMIVFVNEMTPRERRPRSAVERFLLVLAPFAPHIAEELWQRLGHAESLAYEPWPAFDPDMAREPQVEIAVQVNGKVKTRMTISADAGEEQMKQIAMDDPKVKAGLKGKSVRKVICVPGRLVNIVAK